MGTNLTFPTGSPQGIRFVLVNCRVPYLTLLWWWLHLTLLRWRRWLHLTLLWRLRPLRRLFLLFLFRLWCLGDHKHTSEWRGECWTKRHSPQDQADEQPLFRVGHPPTILSRCKTKETSADESVPTGARMYDDDTVRNPNKLRKVWRQQLTA